MGFLHAAEPLKWEDARQYCHHVRDHGIEQFLNIYHAVKDVKNDQLRFGDELEYALLRLEGEPDDPNRTVKISLRATEIKALLEKSQEHGMRYGLSPADVISWMPEYGAWMLEGVPS